VLLFVVAHAEILCKNLGSHRDPLHLVVACLDVAHLIGDAGDTATVVYACT
jgi:hypothetical protein